MTFAAASPPSPDAASPSVAGRLLALDVGSKRIGAALCDELQLTVRPLPALAAAAGREALLDDIAALIRRHEARALVLGWPLRLDGSEGEAARRVSRLACELAARLDVAVYLQDERHTSQAAEEILRDRGLSHSRRRRAAIDSQAAALILRDFLSAPAKNLVARDSDRFRRDD